MPDNPNLQNKQNILEWKIHWICFIASPCLLTRSRSSLDLDLDLISSLSTNNYTVPDWDFDLDSSGGLFVSS